MKSAFASVDNMLVGKKFPMNIRALRKVVVELLRTFINETTTEHEFNQTLQSLKNDSKLAEHWITNLIIPVFLIMLYIRAEREGDFSLHLYACHRMIPYFFAASHWNYARDSIVYLRTMKNLPNSLYDKFMRGEHIVRLQNGDFNGIWTDMGVESDYMKVGKGDSLLL